MFFGRPLSEPPLLPCPITMLADERLHGPALHHRIALNLGSDGVDAGVAQLQSPLPGLPAEQLLFLPQDVGWNSLILPVDLRPLGGGICLIRCERSDTCAQVLATALEQQGRFRALQGVLGRCSLGWFSLGSQPLILHNVDALQFAHGPEPAQVQPLFGASLEPPFTLDTLMQVSASPAGPPVEVFSGFSANHAVLFTPNGLVYVEVPVFADANTYRRLVALQASPTADGGIMRVWQPLPSLPRVQFLEIHCTSPAVPCILDFRPTGWRIVTTCVDPPVTPNCVLLRLPLTMVVTFRLIGPRPAVLGVLAFFIRKSRCQRPNLCQAVRLLCFFSFRTSSHMMMSARTGLLGAVIPGITPSVRWIHCLRYFRGRLARLPPCPPCKNGPRYMSKPPRRLAIPPTISSKTPPVLLIWGGHTQPQMLQTPEPLG